MDLAQTSRSAEIVWRSWDFVEWGMGWWGLHGSDGTTSQAAAKGGIASITSPLVIKPNNVYGGLICCTISLNEYDSSGIHNTSLDPYKID
jgi:hypothetical protein